MKKYILCIVLVMWMLVNFTFAIDYDFDKVSDAWLSRNNDLRMDLWLNQYKYDSKLNITANKWSEHMSELWTWTHKRENTDWFYNYNSIWKRFADRWLVFDNVNRTTYTENVWVWYVNCKQEECTNEVIKAIKTTRNMYIWEAKYGWAHYRSLINKNFRIIWLGLYINAKNKYYLTIHYWTKIKNISESKITSEIPKIKQININELDKLSIN